MNVINRAKNPAQIEPGGKLFREADQREPLGGALSRWGLFGPEQTAGKFYPIACVALEIVQRCNLDCTLCYLSHSAEMAHDVPLTVLFARIDMIESHYGPGTFIQITGGDPTLRRVEDLEGICSYIKQRNMNSCLMTNGIRATDEMLGRLASAGLNDVAFHVDTTQERSGFRSEKSLNGVRQEYIARAKRAGLRILFNTTIYDGNFNDILDLAEFFRENSADIALTSFQMQAETGRGVCGERNAALTQDSVIAALQSGMNVPLDFEAFAVGHPSCTRYASLLVAGDQVVPAISDRALFHEIVAVLQAEEIRKGAYLDIWATARRAILRYPKLAVRSLVYGLGRLWLLRRGIWTSRGKISRMAVLIHNFMDAAELVQDRCETCVFMVATENGPLSMCVHNAERDRYVFEPAHVQTPDGTRWWSAATGKMTENPQRGEIGKLPFKRLKGRMRAAAKLTRKLGHG